MKALKTMDAYREADRLGAAFLANVILCQHSTPAAKLNGLVNLLSAGHTVSTAQHSIDILLIDGVKASWCVLDEWRTRRQVRQQAALRASFEGKVGA